MGFYICEAGSLSEEWNHINLVFIMVMYELAAAMNHGTVCFGACVRMCILCAVCEGAALGSLLLWLHYSRASK